MPVEYIQGAELPDITIRWTDSDGTAIDFTSGWTFTVRIGQVGQAAVVQKTTGITGSDGASNTPNLVISWSSTEIESVAAATYSLQVIARHTGSGKDRKLQDSLIISPQVLPP
jgi:hypothetical protein